jgi:exodeoxyribonuclease VII large subunit
MIELPLESARRAEVFSVAEFSRKMRALFRRVPAFDYLGVSGEISEWTPRPNGVYFTLKDSNAILQCFAYSDRARKFGELPVGAAVIAYGNVRVADWRSRYELLVEDVKLTGIGELYRQYEALKERFRRLGYFEADRKRAVPAFPRSVALISAQGKGAEDFMTTLRDRARQVRVEFIETRVQGIGADVEIAQALDRAARTPIDVIVLARGGGSYEDLFAFNREPVVMAIVRSNKPIITGIGHTADHHLADEVADFVCETPSNAAQFIASLWQRGGERLARLIMRLEREMRDLLARAMERADAVDERLVASWERAVWRRRQTLSNLERRITAQNPALLLTAQIRRLAQLAVALDRWPQRASERRGHLIEARQERMQVLIASFLAQRKNAFALMAARLVAADPMRPLERGYAIVTHGGRALRDASEVSRGATIEAQLYHGRLTASVERVLPDE